MAARDENFCQEIDAMLGFNTLFLFFIFLCQEIDAMLGSNTDCPGPGCMEPPKDPAVAEATKYASSRFAPQTY